MCIRDRASGELRQAQAIRAAERDHLRAVHERLSAYAASTSTTAAPTVTAVLDPELEALRRRASAGQASATQIGSPLPNRLPDKPAVKQPVEPPQRGIDR